MSDLHAHAASGLAYVRKEMLPERPAPASTVGIIGWMRANLFDGWFNSILTVVCLIFIWYVLSLVLGWAIAPTWGLNSLSECREVLKEMGREGHYAGACWGVIRERWIQLLFGFYPAELYWRPITLFVLLFVALAPVLFSELPRKMLWFTALYPFLAVWFIWGGSVWGPVAVIGALVAAGAYFAFTSERASETLRLVLAVIGAVVTAAVFFVVAWFITSISWEMWRDLAGRLFETGDAGAIGAIISVLLKLIVFAVLTFMLAVAAICMVVGPLAALWFIFDGVRSGSPLSRGLVVPSLLAVLFAFAVGPVASGLNSVIPIELTPVESAKLGGFMLAFIIGVSGIAMSLPLGILLALGRQSNLPVLKAFCVGFIEFIRGVPLITLLFVASTLLNIFLPPGTNFDLVLRVIIMVTLFSAAYMAETIRGGLAAIPKGQYEAAASLGLTYWQSQRLVIMPQALKISIPGIVGNFIGLFKDTTLVSVIGLLDPLNLATNIRADVAWNGILWELYGFIALGFFIVCFSMSRYSMYLERKLATDHR